MGHGHHHEHQHAPTGNIKVAFFLNLAFTLIEIAGGIFTNSVAILSDALHDLGDSLSLGLAWYFQHVSRKGRSRNFSYGYKRFSLFGALINSIVLLVGSVFILTEAIPRLLNPEPTNALGMIWLAILGVVVNGAAVFRLKKGSSLNEKVVSLHLLEDVLGWVAVLVGAVLMYFFGWNFIDPLLSLLIAAFVLLNVFRNMKQVLKIIMQGVPAEVDLEKIKNYLKSITVVQEIHDLHVWSMDGEYNVLTVHMVVGSDKHMQELNSKKQEIREQLHEMGVEHATLELEMEHEKCVLDSC